KPPLRPVSLPGAPDGRVFAGPPLMGSWKQAASGIEYPYTGKRRPITFDHAIAQGRDDMVLAHLDHPLVQMSLRLLRAEFWAHEARRRLNRVAVRSIAAGTADEPTVIVWSRLVISGGDRRRLHEELTMAGGELKVDGFARIRSVRRLEELLAASTAVEPGQETLAALRQRFEEQEQPILRAVEARSRERLES